MTHQKWCIVQHGLENSGLLEEDMVEITVEGSQVNVGESVNRVTGLHIKRKLGDEDTDVLDNYDITIIPGTLTVIKRELRVKAADATKQYDGTPLTCSEYEISETSTVPSGLLAAHKAVVTIQGARNEVGTGDTNNWWLWVLMLLSGGYLVEEGIHYSRKKRDSRK